MLSRILRCPSFAAVLAITLSLLLTLKVSAQSDPTNFATVINVPPQTAPTSIGSSTQLNLGNGGTIGANFLAGNPDGSTSNVEVNISGGVVGDQFAATGSVINISGGTLADFFPRSGSVFNISGGKLGDGFSLAEAGSIVNISGGAIDTNFRAADGSIVNFSGGKFYGGDFDVRAQTGSVFNISGGTMGRSFIGEGGSSVTLRGGTVGVDFRIVGNAEIIGGDYQLNGVDFSGSSITLADGDVFTGVLADGAPFVFSPFATDRLENVQLTLAPLPPIATTPIDIPGPTNPVPAGLRRGQSLTLHSGGVLGDNFAVVGAVLNVEGGLVGRSVEVVDGTLNVSGGRIGGPISVGHNVNAYAGSHVRLSGGEIVGALHAFKDSDVEISAGKLSTLDAESNSTVLVSGGRIDGTLTARNGSQVTLKGGTVAGIGQSLVAMGGSTAKVQGGRFGHGVVAVAGSVELIGNEFQLNGVDYAPDTINLNAGDVFTGTLSDGSVFAFSKTVGDSLASVRLTRALLPTVENSPIVIEASSTAPPNGLRPGESLVIRNGGKWGDNMAAVEASIKLQNGSIAEGLEVFYTQVDVEGGTIADRFTAYAGSVVNVTGGTVGRTLALGGSEFNVSGGRFRNGMEVTGGAVLNLSGGAIVGNFAAYHGSTVNLIGTAFLLNGTPIDSLTPGESFTILARSSGLQQQVLSGLLADGSPFSFALNARTPVQSPFFAPTAKLTVTLVAVPEPSALLLTWMAAAVSLFRRRHSNATAR